MPDHQWKTSMDAAHSFLARIALGMSASTGAHCFTLVGQAVGSAIEANPCAVILGRAGLAGGLTSGIDGAARVLSWVVGKRRAGDQAGTLVFRAAIPGVTGFVLFDATNDLVVVK